MFKILCPLFVILHLKLKADNISSVLACEVIELKLKLIVVHYLYYL